MTVLWGQELTRPQLLERVGSLSQIADVTLTELTDGPGRGARVLRFRNAGSLSFEVMLDRASDIGRVDAAGRPVAFWSAAGATPPWRWEHRPDAEGFLRAFGGGLFVTCGLDHHGNPEQDPDPSPDGSTTGQHYPVHGRVTGIPATVRSYGTTWDGDTCELYAETEVRQAAMFGENLLLRRRISTVLGSTAITVVDTVVNEGFRPTPHMVLYHCNLGFPAIDDSTVLSFEPALDALDGPSMPTPIPDPAPDWESKNQWFASAGAAETTVSASSRTGSWTLRYSSDTMPYLLLWQNFASGEYALGIEPATNNGLGRQTARERGELKILAPGESITHHLYFEFLAPEGYDNGVKPPHGVPSRT